MIDDIKGYLITAHFLQMKPATLNNSSQLRFSRGYPLLCNLCNVSNIFGGQNGVSIIFLICYK